MNRVRLLNNIMYLSKRKCSNVSALQKNIKTLEYKLKNTEKKISILDYRINIMEQKYKYNIEQKLSKLYDNVMYKKRV